MDRAAKLLSERCSPSEAAEYFLAPDSRPDLLLEVLLAAKNSTPTQILGARVPAARKSLLRHGVRLLIFFCVIAVISCAVGQNQNNSLAMGNGLAKEVVGADPDRAGEVEQLDTAVQSAWDSTWRMVAGSPLPDPLERSFAGRLLRGDWSGLFLLDRDGDLKAVAKPETSAAVTQWLARYRGLEDENLTLRKTMESLSAVQNTQKIYLEIDLAANRLHVKMGAQTLYDFPVVTGKGFAERDSGVIRQFQTPRGMLKVIEKQLDPVWIPPAWNWTERGQTPPAYRAPVYGHLGHYRLLFPDGIGIHGTGGSTINPGKFSHGCIRMNAKDLKLVYELADVGTELYIY
jgi:hypothetical protein